MKFKTNAEGADIATPSIGNIVRLEYNDEFQNTRELKVEIIDKTDETDKEYKGKICMAMGNGNKEEDENSELLDKEIYFNKKNIFEILK